MCLGGEAQKLNQKVVWRAETSHDKVWGLALGEAGLHSRELSPEGHNQISF